MSELQSFLLGIDGIFIDGEVTGYYGPLTTRAVERYQQSRGIVSGGNPNTTGFGAVGPLTREFMNLECELGSSGGDIDTDSNDDEEGGIGYKDLGDITVEYDTEDDSADVSVVVDDAEDITFSISYTSRSKAIKAIGEALEEEHNVDFGTLSDSRRDSYVKKKISWDNVTERPNNDDNDDNDGYRTEEDIKDITISGNSNDTYVDVEVDLRNERDVEFEVTRSARSTMVNAVAERLDRSYDFDFSGFSSDRRRDAYLDSRTTVNITSVTPPVTPTTTPPTPPIVPCATGCEAYSLDDVKTITYALGTDKKKTYTITLNNGTTRTVTILKNYSNAQITVAFGNSGYTGVAKTLIAKAVESNSFTLADVKTITHVASGTTTTYTITLKNETKRTVRTNIDMTSTQVTNAFTASGYSGDVTALMAKSSVSASDKYNLGQVKTVTHVLNADQSKTYTITLKNGTTRSVRIGKNMNPTQVTLAFGNTGYTGVANKLIAMSKLAKTYALADVKTITQATVKATTTYTITLKNNTKRTVRTSTRMNAAQVTAAFTASGYSGNVQALIAKANGGGSNTGKYALVDVKTVTKKAATATNPTRYVITYTITLKNGKKHTVVWDLSNGSAALTKAVRATGYTGDVDVLIKRASYTS